MGLIQKVGLGLFFVGLTAFLVVLGLGSYQLEEKDALSILGEGKAEARVLDKIKHMYGKEYTSKFNFIADFDCKIEEVNESFKANSQWDYVMHHDYTSEVVRASYQGIVVDNKLLFFILCFVLPSLGALLYFFPEIKRGPPKVKNDGIYHSSLKARGWIGIVLGTFLVAFYIFLYWFPEYLMNWIVIADPVSNFLNGGNATSWFLYGLMYTIAILVMGVRMLIKYKGNKYQVIRTYSVMFFQLAFAFLIPEIMRGLNLPAMDLKNIWPLDYSFFFEYRLNELTEAGTLGIWMLGWGIALIGIAVPVFSYFYGKRWYCSWVCGCGGLAETAGDPFRHLSDKGLKSWKIERWMIHSVLVFAVIMTAVVLYTYFSGKINLVAGVSSYDVRAWYGFLIGSAFAGVVGTGFYPLMGNRVWCRFGCPLAAYIGFVQRFKSRFRITTNGGQCISCGNCSTYCEMGIDVRWYAQRGQNIVRSSCVGCGICSSVCPRGVLKLENGPEEGRINDNPILIGKDEVTLNPETATQHDN